MNFLGARLHYITISSKISIAKIIIMSKLIARDQVFSLHFFICMMFLDL